MSNGHRKRMDEIDTPAQRKRACSWPLLGNDALRLKGLRDRIKRGSGMVRYVYRESDSASQILISNHEIKGRKDLVGVYNHHVTVAMLRQDLYHEDPADIRFADWGKTA